jgi:serine/threonine protein kinase
VCIQCQLFEAVNIKTEEVRAVKIIKNVNDDEFMSRIKIGINLSETCPHLVRYYSGFKEGKFQVIVLDYFENGDLKSYLSKNNKLNEEVFFFFFFFFICYNKGCYSFVISDNNSHKRS